jgi:hypothetical protein
VYGDLPRLSQGLHAALTVSPTQTWLSRIRSLALGYRRFSPSLIVTALYSALLDRQPTGGEERTTVRRLKRGDSLENTIARFLASPELQASYYRNPIFWPVIAPDPLPSHEERLYFWHVPKTGGTSLTEMLQRHFAPLEFCSGLHLGELYRMSNYRLRSFRVIAGHFGPIVPQLLADVQLTTATVIREPVSQIASHYMHWRDWADPTTPMGRFTRDTPFDQWCRSQATRQMWSNPQASSLTSSPVPPRNRGEFELSPAGTLRPLPPERLRDASLSTLDSIDIVGTTGDLLSVYTACLRRLDREPTLETPIHTMVSAGLGFDISDATRNWLLDHNTIDQALFDRARSRATQLQPDASRPSAPPSSTHQ